MLYMLNNRFGFIIQGIQKCHFLLLFVTVWPFLYSANAADNFSFQFRAGASAVDITPQKFPIRIAGSITEITATRVEDPLHARSIVFENGKTEIALCIVDNCMMPREMIEEAKTIAHRSTGIPKDHILVAATHTHSAPAVMGVHGTDPELDYREFLIQKIAESIHTAHKNLNSARIGWASDICEEFVFCRRWIMKPGKAFTVPFTGRTENQAKMNPGYDNMDKIRQTGPVDSAVTVLSVQTPEGQPIALLANYSTHYAGAPNISADYFGVFARRIGELICDTSNTTIPFTGIMSNGTSGDANCIDFSKPKRDFDRFTVAESVAQAALRAYHKIEYHEWVPLLVEEKPLELLVRKPTVEEIKEAQAYLDKNVINRPIRNWEENYARETVFVGQMPKSVELKLQAVRIGDLGIAAIPCETFGSTGLALKKQSPFPLTMNIELANGAFGYLPPPDQFELGGYTTWRARTSYLESTAEPKIVSSLLNLLHTVKAAEKP